MQRRSKTHSPLYNHLKKPFYKSIPMPGKNIALEICPRQMLAGGFVREKLLLGVYMCSASLDALCFNPNWYYISTVLNRFCGPIRRTIPSPILLGIVIQSTEEIGLCHLGILLVSGPPPDLIFIDGVG